MSDAPKTFVDHVLRDDLSFLIGLLDPDSNRRRLSRSQLPASLLEWDSGMVFELALALMPLTETAFKPRRGRRLPIDALCRHAESLAQTADMIRGWPQSFVETLTAKAKKRADSVRDPSYKGIAHYIAGYDSNVLPYVVSEAFKRALAPLISPLGGTPPDQIGMGEASVLTGHEESHLTASRRAGQIKTRICLKGNRVFPALDRAEIESLNHFIKNRVGPEMASWRLGLPQYAIAQFVAAGLITVEEHPYITGYYGVYQLTEVELALFLGRLRQAGQDHEPPNKVPLHRVARAIGGGLKPWGRIFMSLLDGNIPYAITGESIDRIWVSDVDAAEIMQFEIGQARALGLRKHISQRDAVEILNLPLRHAHVLASARCPGGAHRVDWRVVHHLAQTRITLAELSARTGIQNVTLEAKLKRDGLPRQDCFGWIRRDALAKIETY